jgi:hypothetical protein
MTVKGDAVLYPPVVTIAAECKVFTIPAEHAALFNWFRELHEKTCAFAKLSDRQHFHYRIEENGTSVDVGLHCVCGAAFYPGDEDLVPR